MNPSTQSPRSPGLLAARVIVVLALATWVMSRLEATSDRLVVAVVAVAAVACSSAAYPGARLRSRIGYPVAAVLVVLPTVVSQQGWGWAGLLLAPAVCASLAAHRASAPRLMARVP